MSRAMARKFCLSELDLLHLLKRYNSSTLVTLLREIAKCKSSKLDWALLAKCTATGITSAREYQAVWRSIAYRAELLNAFEDNDQALEDESDIEVEPDPVPAISPSITESVANFVKQSKELQNYLGHKAELQQHDIEETRMERDVSQIAGMGLQVGDMALRTGQQEATTSGMSDGSATFRARGNPYLANGPAEFATTPISSMTSTKSAYTESNADKKRRRLWTPAEDLELISAVEKCGEGNWTSVLKCPYNFDRSASQLSQRWALIRKRREVQDKAGYREGSGPSTPAYGVSEGQTEGLQTGTQVAPNPSTLGKPRMVGSTGQLGDISRPSGGGPMANKPALPSSTGQVQIKRGVPGSHSAEASDNVSEAQRMRTSQVAGVSSSRAGVSGPWQPSQSPYPMRVSGTLTGAATGAVQTHNTGTTPESASGGAQFHGSGSTVRRPIQAGASQMRPTGALPTVTTASADNKYNVPRLTVQRGVSKGPHGPDPMVQAAAMAAGARIAPASAAASLLMAAQSGNVVHIGTGGVPRSKSSLSSQSGNPQLMSNPGAIVHYIRTGSGGPSASQIGPGANVQRPPVHHASKSQSSRGFGNTPGTHTAGVSNPASGSARNNPHSQNTLMSGSKSNPTMNRRNANPQQKMPTISTPMCTLSTADQVIELDSEGASKESS